MAALSAKFHANTKKYFLHNQNTAPSHFPEEQEESSLKKLSNNAINISPPKKNIRMVKHVTTGNKLYLRFGGHLLS